MSSRLSALGGRRVRRLRVAGPGAYRTAALGVSALGAALRLLAYADRRPLWMDEVMLSLNVAERSFAGLARPLDYVQIAPLFFLWAQRVAVLVGGVNEWALRALPLACGLALPPLLWVTGRRLLGEREALVATVLAALSSPLVYYSAEAKPYAGDTVATAALLLLAAAVLQAPAEARRWRRLGVAGAVAVGVSQPSVFVLAAVVAALLLSPAVRASARWRARLVACVAAWGAVFLPLYVGVYRQATATNAYMQRTWGEVFLVPGAPDLGARLHAVLRDLLVMTILPGWPPPSATVETIAYVAYAAGVWALWRGRRVAPDVRRPAASVAALLTLPLAAAAVASALRLYPLSLRVALFSAPPVFLTFGAAAAWAVDVLLPARRARESARWARGTAFGAAVALLVRWRVPTVREEAIHPRRYEDTRDVIADYLRRRSPDPVYVYAGGVPSWVFYTTDWRAPDRARLRWMARVAGPLGTAFENRPSRGHPVVHEADELVYAAGGRREVIGVGTGMEYRERVRGLYPLPDSGWADNEARRLREAVDASATPGRYAWVYLAHHGELQRDLLIAAMRRQGARIVVVNAEDTAELYRLSFTPGP